MCSSRHLLLILICTSIENAHAVLTRPFLDSSRYNAGYASQSKVKHTTLHHLTRHCSPFTPTASSTLGWFHSSSSRATTMSTGAADASPVWPPTDSLSEYVTESSLVDYGRLAAHEREWLAPVIKSIKATDPRKMDAAERHAFLINAYNLWTLHWVVRERRTKPCWKGAVSTFAKARFFYWHRISTGMGSRNLFNFENKDIRPEVNDARVHFALNCASMSCPPLRRKLFTGAALDAELDEITSAAINGGAFVQLSQDGKTLSVNPIFKWYKEDFDKEGGTLAFIKNHWTGRSLPDDTNIDFFEYDWRSNSVDATWADQALGGPAP